MGIIHSINEQFSLFIKERENYIKNIGRETSIIDKNIRDIITRNIPGLFQDIINEEMKDVASDYTVTGSIGKGLLTRNPWVAILNRNITTSTRENVYIVFLLSKDLSKIYITLNQGTTVPGTFGNRLGNKLIIESRERIRKLLNVNSKLFIQDSQPDVGDEKYKEGTIFYYEWNISSKNEKSLFGILKSYIEVYTLYKNMIQSDSMKEVEMKKAQTNKPKETLFSVFSIKSLSVDIKKTGLLYSDMLLNRFVTSLVTKSFVILSGLSGSGKTRLALAFARWICDDESQIRLIAVGADWTNREYLLGYPNALKEGAYVLPENQVLNIILEADKHPDKPYFLILDEMNLSYVERYFADFLCSMESGEEISLHPEGKEWSNDIPAKIKLPKNLFIIGTINVDETTYMFSPKVLDRANVIEFRISNEEMSEFLKNIEPLKKDAADKLGAHMATSFVELATEDMSQFGISLEDQLVLLNFFKTLQSVGAEFGYRTVTDIYRFIIMSEKLKINWKKDEVMDIVIIQKLLPKLHGSRKKIVPVLVNLFKLCLSETKENKQLRIDSDFELENNKDKFKYQLSVEKILRMYRGAIDNGFTSFAEA